MDPIGRPCGIAPSGAAPLRPRRAASGFALPDAAAAAPAGAAVPLGGLLALQEYGDEPLGDREARRRGQALLAELAALQRDMLADAVSTERLARLGRLAEQVTPAAHPALRSALEAVVLRARIELARFGGT